MYPLFNTCTGTDIYRSNIPQEFGALTVSDLYRAPDLSHTWLVRMLQLKIVPIFVREIQNAAVFNTVLEGLAFYFV